jgi:glycerophosphoryl diester phosphodiesterase
MNSRHLGSVMRNALLTTVGSLFWVVLVGLWVPSDVFGASSGPQGIGRIVGIVVDTVQDGLMARDLAVPPGPQSKHHTLDDCIRNPLCKDVLAVGHRGTMVWGPENTIPAFETALAMGADAVEMDVQETKDGELILMHDATLDRTTDCRGEVAQKSLAEIKGCKVIPLLPGIESAPIPTFWEALNALRGRTVIEVDVKAPLSAAKVAREVSQARMTNQVMVLTSSIVAAKSVYAPRGIAVLAQANSYSEVLEFLGMSPKPVAIEVDIKLLPQVQDGVHRGGSRVSVDALEACDLIGVACYRQLVSWGADLIQTDNLPKLVPVLNPGN